jgi:hypothetical protein
LVLFIGTASSTTPLCTVTDGMASNMIIPSSEINVSDKTVAVDNLRPESPTPLQSSYGTLIIEYSPSTARPMKEIELVSTDNIKSYKVTFYNKDGSVTTKTVRTIRMNIVCRCYHYLYFVYIRVLCIICSTLINRDLQKKKSASALLLSFEV